MITDSLCGSHSYRSMKLTVGVSHMSMPIMEQFTYGPVNPIVAFIMSLIGAVFGLGCVARARRCFQRSARLRWILLGSFAIGGVGIWLTHFMAMVGFDMPSMQIRYNLALIAASLAIAIGAVGAGLLVACFPKVSVFTRPSKPRILVGGTLIGIGVAGMHYTGMTAMQLAGNVSYEPRLFVASIVIAIVASVVTLWITLIAKSARVVGLAAAVFALAVCSTHYTAMTALHVDAHPTAVPPVGINPLSLVVPLIVIAILALLAMLFAGLTLMGDDDLAPPASHRQLEDDTVTAIPFALASPFITGDNPPGEPSPNRHAR